MVRARVRDSGMVIPLFLNVVALPTTNLVRLCRLPYRLARLDSVLIWKSIAISDRVSRGRRDLVRILFGILVGIVTLAFGCRFVIWE